MPEEVKKFKSKASGTIFDTFEEAKADEAKYSALSDKKNYLSVELFYQIGMEVIISMIYLI